MSASPHQKKESVVESAVSSKSERTQIDSEAEMGYATTRSLERVAAAMGALESAPIQFEPAQDVSQGGVLLALPALLATGLLRFTQQFYALPKGFYGIDSIFLLLALMALARIPSIEQLRYAAPGEWGNLLGLDRVPEVRTLRAKLELLCREAGRAVRWHTALAREWIAGVVSSELVFYADGHVRVYHGDLTALPRHYVARERLCMRATTDYWIHAMDGQPFFYINKEVDPGLIATLRHDLVPFLENQVPLSVELQKRMEDNPRQHRFTLVFDREAYSPELFAEMQAKRIAVVTYHKYPGEDSGGRVPRADGRVGRGRCSPHEAGRARIPAEQRPVGAASAQAFRRRQADGNPEHRLCGRLHSAGSLDVRPMVAGKLLQIYAGTLWPGSVSGVWHGSRS